MNGNSCRIDDPIYTVPEQVAMISHDPVTEIQTAYQYLHDALGSVIGLVDEAGFLVERYTYDPYGKVFIETWDAAANGGSGAFVPAETYCGLGATACGKMPYSPTGNPFMWTGHRYDAAVGLYHTLFRFYDPTLGRWLQRDPLGNVDGVSLYEYSISSPLFLIDPLGLSSTTLPFDEYWEEWKKKHPGYSEEQYRKIKDTLSRGCIGVTCVELGESRNPDLSNCYKSRSQAEKRRIEMTDKEECKGKTNVKGKTSTPRMFSVRFWAGQNSYDGDPKTGKVNMSPWDYKARPSDKDGGYTNFDYGIYDPTTGMWIHANHRQPGMKVYRSSLRHYSRQLSDFNTQVFCVACEDTKIAGPPAEECNGKTVSTKPVGDS